MKTQISAYFNDFNAGAKKDVIKLEIRGELTDEQIVKLHKLKGNSVVVTLASGQMEMEDYEGEDYQNDLYAYDRLNDEGQQMSIDDVPPVETSEEPAGSDEVGENGENSTPAEEEQEQEQEEQPKQEPDQEPAADKVADNKERKRRGRPKKEEKQEEKPTAAPADDLPF
ncbi:hypothetical protein [Paenibacillus apiarius]|uniref:hypothetical protein n=1 Tax=Paenibacillus apiarius TaxID=46240 RepID=UPI003B3AD2A9